MSLNMRVIHLPQLTVLFDVSSAKIPDIRPADFDMSTSFQDCSDMVTASCPIEATVLGYAPSQSWNIAYTVVFVTCCVGQLILGFRYKVKAYSWVVGLGCFAEVVGFGGRIVLHAHPWDEWALGTYLIALPIGSGFLASGIYLTLKRAMLILTPQRSIYRAVYTTNSFIAIDILSITIQAIAGAIASVGNSDHKINASHANTALLVGITLQAASFFVFGVLAVQYVHSLSFHRTLSPAADVHLKDRRFHMFAGAIALAYLFLLIRCIFRIVEMAGGWTNSISRSQTSFMIADGLMVVFATLALTIMHPGIFFQAMSSRAQKQVQVEMEDGKSGQV